MTSVSANPNSSDSMTLEHLLFKATNPSNKLEDVNTIKQLCDEINKGSPEHGSAVTCRLLAHKIHSPQEREAVQALAVLEACVKSCGPPFHAEVGKFKFLNEMIKLVSPKYQGSKTPEHIKKKVIELLYVWCHDLKGETKIIEAYEMLKTQGIVKEDPSHVGEAVFASSLPPRDQDPLDEEQSKLLKKLLQSKNPDDLQQANKIIKGMVKDDERKMDALSRRTAEINTVLDNTKLLNEMLDNFTKSEEELELLKELYSVCGKMQPKLSLMASEVEEGDESIADILNAGDEIDRVLKRYESVVIECGQSTNMDLCDIAGSTKTNNNSDLLKDELDVDILKISPQVTVSPSIDDLLNGSPIQTECPPLCSSLLPSSIPKPPNSEYTAKLEESKISRIKGLEELDSLGENALKALLPQKSPQFAKKNEKVSLNDLQKKTSMEKAFPNFQENALKTVKTDCCDKNDEINLKDIEVPLSKIQPGALPPLILQDRPDGLNITLHFGKEGPAEFVHAIVITVINKSSESITDFEFKAVVSKGCKLKLQSQSNNELPAHNSPFLPPPAITQVMLISNPRRIKIAIKYVITYVQDEELRTITGACEELPI